MPERLPIHDIEHEIVSSLRKNRRLILQAPTGSGKSTRVPRMLLEHGLLGSGRCVTLQPRRLAARMLAARVAEEMGAPLGGTVGYQVRLDNRRSKDTRILFETEGILLRRMNDDPRLEGTSAIIFDEFHERHIYGDVSLARALDVQETSRPDLILVVMSATMDIGPLERYLDPVTVLKSEGRTFPVDVEFRPPKTEHGRRSVPVWDLAADAFAREVRRGYSGNALIFMPGAYEIRRTIDALSGRSEARGHRLAPLHGQLPAREQDLAVRTGGEPRVVVSTNVAETSITIEGIDLVIDSGLHRILRYDPRRGINTLLVETISRSSADQRAGRAGRTRPGRALRLWSASEDRERRATELPEVRRLDLSEVVLTLRAADIDPKRFRWLDAPSEESLEHADALLVSLGAVESSTRDLSALGRRMLAFPTHPRYSRLLLAAEELGCVRDACLVAALSQGRDLLVSKPGRRVLEARDAAFGPKAVSDFWIRMRAFDYARAAGFRPDALDELGIHRGAAREADQVFEQYLGIAQAEGLGVAPRETRFVELRRAILTGFSDRVGRRNRERSLRCVLTGTRRGTIDKTSVVDSPLFVAADVLEIGSRKGEVDTTVALLTAIEVEWLREMFPDETRSSVDVWMDSVTRQIRAEERIRFRDLVIDSVLAEAPPDRIAEVLAEEIITRRMTLPLWDRKVDEWILRVNLVARECPELGIEPIGDEEKRAILEQLAFGASGYKELKNRPVLPAFRAWLSPEMTEAVDAYAPERVRLENGKTPRVVYSGDEPPSISLRIQELYGVSSTPTIAMGRVTPVVKILAPNMRPVQVTTDLGRFWKEHYPEIRPALSRRYPKHEWR